jgi:trimethylamine--corrinoid protein Co-methyltransferase
MFRNAMPRYEILSEDAMNTLDGGWRRLVSEIGVEFGNTRALELFRQAGQKVEDDCVKFDPEFLLEQVAKAPRSFDVQARNPANTVHIGDVVRIVETRPLSKTKRWRLAEIVEVAK